MIFSLQGTIVIQENNFQRWKLSTEVSNWEPGKWEFVISSRNERAAYSDVTLRKSSICCDLQRLWLPPLAQAISSTEESTSGQWSVALAIKLESPPGTLFEVCCDLKWYTCLNFASGHPELVSVATAPVFVTQSWWGKGGGQSRQIVFSREGVDALSAYDDRMSDILTTSWQKKSHYARRHSSAVCQ